CHYLADCRHRIALVCGAVQFVGSKVKRVRRARPERHRRVEQYRVGVADPVGLRNRAAVARKCRIISKAAASKRPRVLHRKTRSQICAIETDEVIRLVEERVVHRDVSSVGGALVDEGESAISTFGRGPVAGGAPLLSLGAVVLSAADCKVLMNRMHRHAYELDYAELPLVLAQPGC